MSERNPFTSGQNSEQLAKKEIATGLEDHAAVEADKRDSISRKRHLEQVEIKREEAIAWELERERFALRRAKYEKDKFLNTFRGELAEIVVEDALHDVDVLLSEATGDFVGVREDIRDRSNTLFPGRHIHLPDADQSSALEEVASRAISAEKYKSGGRQLSMVFDDTLSVYTDYAPKFSKIPYEGYWDSTKVYLAGLEESKEEIRIGVQLIAAKYVSRPRFTEEWWNYQQKEGDLALFTEYKIGERSIEKEYYDLFLKEVYQKLKSHYHDRDQKDPYGYRDPKQRQSGEWMEKLQERMSEIKERHASSSAKPS